MQGENHKVIHLLENTHFQQAFGQREATLTNLQTFQTKHNIDALIALDGTQFSSCVKKLETPEAWLHFLDAGIDGAILQVSQQTLQKVGIIIGVGDCAVIAWNTRDKSHIFSIHAWYKGTLGNGEEENKGIIANLFLKLTEDNIEAKDIEKLYIGPMAGSNFELPRSYYQTLSKEIKNTYAKINFESYFKVRSNTWNSDISELKWTLNLRKLIKDILMQHDIQEDQLFVYPIDTTNPSNRWPSYRLFSNKLQEKNTRLSQTILSIVK